MANPIATPPAKLELPVEVIGADVYGQQFLESTRTLTIHQQGVSILLACNLALDSEVIVRNPETNEEAIAFVVGQTSEDATGHIYGLAFLDPSADPWHIQFPAGAGARLVRLECSGCHSVHELSLSGIELEIYEAKGELTRSCKICNTSRIWKETTLEVRTKKPGYLSGRDLNSKSIASPMEERRKNRRTAMKTSGCVRFSGVEVVVDCEDISKGGFRFTSRKEYPARNARRSRGPVHQVQHQHILPGQHHLLPQNAGWTIPAWRDLLENQRIDWLESVKLEEHIIQDKLACVNGRCCSGQIFGVKV